MTDDEVAWTLMNVNSSLLDCSLVTCLYDMLDVQLCLNFGLFLKT